MHSSSIVFSHARNPASLLPYTHANHFLAAPPHTRTLHNTQPTHTHTHTCTQRANAHAGRSMLCDLCPGLAPAAYTVANPSLCATDAYVHPVTGVRGRASCHDIQRFLLLDDAVTHTACEASRVQYADDPIV